MVSDFVETEFNAGKVEEEEVGEQHKEEHDAADSLEEPVEGSAAR